MISVAVNVLVTDAIGTGDQRSPALRFDVGMAIFELMDDLAVLRDDDDHAGEVEQPGDRTNFAVERSQVIGRRDVSRPDAGRSTSPSAVPRAPQTSLACAPPPRAIAESMQRTR